MTRSPARSVVLSMLFASSIVLGAWPSFTEAATYEYNWANPTPQGNGLHALAFESGQVGYAVGVKGTTLITNDAGQTWVDESSYPAFTKDLRDLLVLSPGVLLAVGELPGIYRSEDGGASWSAVSNPGSVDLEDIFRVDANTLFAVGENKVLRSIDNGASWTLRTSPGNVQLTDQFWLSSTRGYILGAFVLKQTTDAGQTWLDVPGVPSAFDLAGDIQFLDAQTGWIFHDFDTYQTTNGGLSWTNVNHGFGNDPFYQDEILLLSATHWLNATNGEGATISETTNAGVDWTLRYSRQNVTGVSEMASLAGGGFCAITTAGDLLRSDTGATWINYTHSPDDGERTSLDVMCVLGSGKAFAGGANVWLVSEDSGATWSYGATNPGVAGPQAIDFFDDLHGLVGGYTSPTTKAGRTTDGGATWSTFNVRPTTAGGIIALDMTSNDIAYAATYGGTGINFVFKTTDGGQTWVQTTNGITNPHRYFSLAFVDSQTGFVGGGDFGTIDLWKTTNGGALWTAVSSAGIGGGAIMAMHWFTASTGLAASDGAIYRTTNGGTNWTSVGDGSRFMDFRDALHGVAGTVFGTEVQVTSDGGVTWQTLDTRSDQYATSIAIVPDGFLVGGSHNTVLHAHEVGASSVEAPNASEAAGVLRGSLGPGVRVTLESANPGRGGIRLAIDARDAGRQWSPRGSVYAIDGRWVADLAVAMDGAGQWRAAWDGDASTGGSAAAGLYLVGITRGPYRAALKQLVRR